MPSPTLTRQQFLALDPCAGGRDRIIAALGGEGGWVSPVTAAQARDAGATLSDLIWAALAVSRTDTDVARRLRLWMADCAAHVLRIYERAEESDAPRNAIVAARKFARGEVGTGDLAAAWAAAWAAANAAEWASERFAVSATAMSAARAAARAAAWAAAWAAARVAVSDTAWAAAWAAANAAVNDTARAAERSAEEAWQFGRLILWLSDDEPEDWPMPPRKEGDA